MAWTVPELEAALNNSAADRNQAQQETVDVAARMLLEFRLAQQAHPAPLPQAGAATGTPEALANAALNVVRLALLEDRFVAGGEVTFAIMDLQTELYAYRSMEPPPQLD